MEPFARLDAVALPMPVANVDTDQIIPARFLRKSRNDGLGQYLFFDIRFDGAGRENPDFVLNRVPYRGARILVAVRNFGCGSSREHAVYALWDYGFRAVVAPSFGNIFQGNCLQNGLLPVVLPADAIMALLGQIQFQPGARVVVDLEQQLVVGPDGSLHRFEIDAFRKQCLLKGLDELGFTLGYRAEIEALENSRMETTPWL